MLPHRRIDANDGPKPGVIARVQQQIARAGFTGDIHAARLGFRQWPQFKRGGNMQHMHARPSPAGQFRRTGYGFCGHNRGPRGNMRQRVIAPRCHQPFLPPRHDGGCFGMQRNA